MADETPFRNTSGQSYIQNYDFTPHAYIRTMPIQTPLQQAIAAAVYAADPNVQIRVSSGGQTSSRSPSLRNKPGGWTGSDRHNEGGAADFSLVRDGKKLPIVGNEGLYQAVARNLAAQGVPGIGVDTRSGFIHAGGGSEAAWGYEGKSNGSRYLPASFATAINEGRQLHRTQGGIPMPPSEIPNVVASRTDTVAPRIAPVPATMSPEIAASREPQQYPPPSPRMSEEQVAALYQGIYPQRNLTYGGEVERSVQSAQNAQDPVLAAALQSRAAPRETPPLPRPRPIMGGDPGGGGIGDLVATIPSTQPLPPQRLPDLPPSTMGRDPSSGQVVSPPIMSKAMVEGATGFRLPQTPPLALAVDPLTEYYNLRGNPDMPKKVPGPSINYTKDQSRLAPGWGTAPTQTAATARAAPIMVGMARQQPQPLTVATAAPQRIAPIPAPLSQRPPPMMVQQPAPVRLAQGQQAPLQVTVQGANSYNGGGTTPGSATGQQYNVGQSYQAGGYNYVFNNDGSVTNTDTGITRGGGRRSYDPDTNTWQ